MPDVPLSLSRGPDSEEPLHREERICTNPEKKGKMMNKLKIALLAAAAAVYSAGAMSAEVYKSDGASLSVYGRVKA